MEIIKKKLKKFKSDLHKRKFLSGAWFQVSDPNVVELVSKNSFDWFCFDFEHGVYNFDKFPDLLRATRINKAVTLVRTLSKNPSDISKILDLGADGIIVPKLETPAELKSIYNATYYPPKGSRGVGFSRANMYGTEFENYRKTVNQNLILVGMIETKKGVQNLDSILKLKLLDAIFIGPYDLSASLGSIGNFKSKDFLACNKIIQNMVKKYKISCGIHVLKKEKFQKSSLQKNNYNFNAYLTDSIFFSDYKI